MLSGSILDRQDADAEQTLAVTSGPMPIRIGSRRPLCNVRRRCRVAGQAGRTMTTTVPAPETDRTTRLTDKGEATRLLYRLINALGVLPEDDRAAVRAPLDVELRGDGSALRSSVTDRFRPPAPGSS
jgi:hypothetical protein